MCGIAGYIGSQRLDAGAIQNCLGLMRRRGPDSASFYEHQFGNKQNVYLLHSRLRIIDLNDRANQPFREASRVLAYNGELYNYVELKQELEARGQRFSTTSDTEVLIRVLGENGAAGLDRCEGMWAFAYYDEQSGALLLSRDRFGEKPLFILRTADGLYFGSEAKFIFAMLGRRAAVNMNHLYRYMVNGYKALYKTRETFFNGVEELPAACVLRLTPSGGVSRPERYWTPRLEVNAAMSYAEAVAGAREALLKSVKLRLRADVPLAFCMSGGVDSNALISIARRVYDYDVHGFTIVNEDERYEEQEMVDHVVRELGVRHTPIHVRPTDFLPRLRTLIKQHDAPIYTITYYAHWLLMESIAQHGYRISISGTAADELFSGYFDHHLAYLYEVRNDPELHARSLKAWETHIKPVVRNPYLSNPNLFIENRDQRAHIYLNADEFSDYLYRPWSEAFAEQKYTDDLLRNRMLNELFHEAVPVILHEDDLNAMYFSIENRSPFLDRGLFDMCFSIPPRHLVQDGAAKAVLRDAMSGIAPDKVMKNRRKVGFNAPIFSFLDVHDPNVVSSLLDDSPIFQYVRKDRIEKLIQRAQLPNSESKFLFNFLNSKIFLEEFSR